MSFALGADDIEKVNATVVRLAIGVRIPAVMVAKDQKVKVMRWRRD